MFNSSVAAWVLIDPKLFVLLFCFPPRMTTDAVCIVKPTSLTPQAISISPEVYSTEARGSFSDTFNLLSAAC